MSVYNEYVEYLKKIAPDAETWVGEQLAIELYTRDNAIKSLNELIDAQKKEIEKLTLERDEARKLANEWSKVGAKIEKMKYLIDGRRWRKDDA